MINKLKHYDNIKSKTQNTSRGFTLIELMVATSIFVVVMLASMSSLFALLGAGKYSRSLRFAMDNVNFAMESMTRSIRMGTNYYCVPNSESMPNDMDVTRDCNDGTYVTFVPPGVPTSRAGYRWDSSAKTLESCTSPSNCVNIVSPDVHIDNLRFFVNGSGVSDNTQASVYIIMKGTITTKDGPTSFAIQTMASQRNF